MKEVKKLLLSAVIATGYVYLSWFLLTIFYSNGGRGFEWYGADLKRMFLWNYVWSWLAIFLFEKLLGRNHSLAPYLSFFYSVKCGFLFLILLVMEIWIHRKTEVSENFHTYLALTTASVPALFGYLRLGVLLNFLEKPE